jgi:hypothetical protein
MKNTKANLMKNLLSSDISPMVLSTMNSPVVSVEMPVCTALIWGFNAVSGLNSAIWGTASIGGATRRQDCSAIWGTAGVWAPVKHAGSQAIHADR